MEPAARGSAAQTLKRALLADGVSNAGQQQCFLVEVEVGAGPGDRSALERERYSTLYSKRDAASKTKSNPNKNELTIICHCQRVDVYTGFG